MQIKLAKRKLAATVNKISETAKRIALIAEQLQRNREVSRRAIEQKKEKRGETKVMLAESRRGLADGPTESIRVER